MDVLKIKNFAHIAEVSLKLGDLTVLVGAQGTGKSLALQWLKAALDGKQITTALRDWVAELQIVRVDHLSATMPGGFRHDLNLLVESPQVKATEDAYGVMLRAAEQIHHRVCGDAQL